MVCTYSVHPAFSKATWTHLVEAEVRPSLTQIQMLVPILQDASSPESHCLSIPSGHHPQSSMGLKNDSNWQIRRIGDKICSRSWLAWEALSWVHWKQRNNFWTPPARYGPITKITKFPQILVSTLMVWPHPSRSQNEWWVKETLSPSWADVEMNVACLVTQKWTFQLKINYQQSKAGRQQDALPSCLRHKPCVIWSYFSLFRADFLKILCLSWILGKFQQFTQFWEQA